MKRIVFLSMALVIFSNVYSIKTIYTYRLVTGSNEPVQPYVFSNTPNICGYKIQLSPSYGGSAPGKFKVKLINGKFPDGKTEKESIYPNEVITVIWDDIPNVNGTIKITDSIPTDTSTTILKSGNSIQISHKIASLKGQTPNMTLSLLSPPLLFLVNYTTL